MRPYAACIGRRLKERGRTFREAFLAKLGLLLRGTVAAPPERFGETLADEHIRGGAPLLACPDRMPTPAACCAAQCTPASLISSA
jgi:hypothetical protein